MSSRFAEALRVTALIFADKKRKGIDTPYISHLLGTCSIALEYGANEDQAIAALLHDAIEDIEPTEKVCATVERFGPEVFRIVHECSDSYTHPKPPWRERKEGYIDRLASADSAVLLVSASDKLHNARAIIADFRYVGSKIWDRFNASREDVLWYYRTLVTTFRNNGALNQRLVDELDRAVTEMEGLGKE